MAAAQPAADQACHAFNLQLHTKQWRHPVCCTTGKQEESSSHIRSIDLTRCCFVDR
jgi:hypothetical protein